MSHPTPTGEHLTPLGESTSEDPDVTDVAAPPPGAAPPAAEQPAPEVAPPAADQPAPEIAPPAADPPAPEAAPPLEDQPEPEDAGEADPPPSAACPAADPPAPEAASPYSPVFSPASPVMGEPFSDEALEEIHTLKQQLKDCTAERNELEGERDELKAALRDLQARYERVSGEIADFTDLHYDGTYYALPTAAMRKSVSAYLCARSGGGDRWIKDSGPRPRGKSLLTFVVSVTDDRTIKGILVTNANICRRDYIRQGSCHTDCMRYHGQKLGDIVSHLPWHREQLFIGRYTEHPIPNRLQKQLDPEPLEKAKFDALVEEKRREVRETRINQMMNESVQRAADAYASSASNYAHLGAHFLPPMQPPQPQFLLGHSASWDGQRGRNDRSRSPRRQRSRSPQRRRRGRSRSPL